MLTVLVFLLASPSVQVPRVCAHDRARILKLDQKSFDQDLQGGWRTIAGRKGCEIVAANLIRDYRAAHKSDDKVLYWHEGQLRALAGHSGAATRLLSRSYRMGADVTGWNAYVDATLAFLRRDRPALLTARARLVQVPRPTDWNPHGPDGRPIAIQWPPNLNVIDGLIACFGQSYAKAYAPPCIRYPK